MKTQLSQQDWMDISAYLDGRLNASNQQRIEMRLKADPQFRQAFREIQHTRKLLRSLPSKRAPRNFTLSQRYATAKTRKWGLRSYMGLLSATAALAVVVIFTGTRLFASRGLMMASPAMLEASAPEAAMDSSLAGTADTSQTPMIITWQNVPEASGMGGGGEPAVTAKGFVTETPAPAAGDETMTLMGTESPNLTIESSDQADPSTLILGLPEPGIEGDLIEESASEPMRKGFFMPASTIWMIALGGVALVFGLLAIILRKR